MNTRVVSHPRAATAFFIGTLFFAYAFMQRVSPSVMTEELMLAFSVGGGALGALSGWYFYAYAAMQLPVGILTDRFGPRKLMAAAAFFCGLATLAMALSSSLLTASVSRALIGGTVGFGFVGTLAIASYFFPAKRFAFLAGILQCVGMLGAIAGQAPLRLVVELYGWRIMLGALAAFGILLALACLFVIPKRPEKNAPVSGNAGLFSGLYDVISRPQSWICAGIGFGMTSIMLGFAALWAVPWLSNIQGYSKPVAAGLASCVFLGWAIFAPIVGWFSDLVGRRKPIVLLGCLCNLIVFSILLYTTPDRTIWLIACLFLLGISGSTVTVMFGAVRELNSVNSASTALGLLNMCIMASGAIMQPAVGVLLDYFWGGLEASGIPLYQASTYASALSVLIVANLIALVCIVGLRETFCRQSE
ncbi:MAG: MFS transporter [Pseudomonadota bacterium]